MNQVVCACGYSSRTTSSGNHRISNALLPDNTTEQCPVCEMELFTTRTEAHNLLAEDDRTAVARAKERNGNDGEPLAVGIKGASGPRSRTISFAGEDVLGARLSVGTGHGRSRAEFKKKIMTACARAAAGKRVAPITGTMCSRTNTSEARGVEDVAVSARA